MKKKIDLNKFQEVVGQLKSAQHQLQSLINKDTLKEAKKYAENSSKELKNWIKNTDMKKVKGLIEKETKEIHKLQKQIPTELAKFAKYVDGQKKELEKILKTVHAAEAADFIQNKLSSTKIGKKVGIKKKPKKNPEKKHPKAAVEPEMNQAEAGPSSDTHQ